MKVYNVNGHKKVNKFVHVDCYRLDNQEDLTEIGLGDYLNYDNIVVVIEWADKILDLPDNTIKVNIKHIDDNKREIVID